MGQLAAQFRSEFSLVLCYHIQLGELVGLGVDASIVLASFHWLRSYQELWDDVL